MAKSPKRKRSENNPIVGEIETRKGYLYYVDKDGAVREAKMKWNKKKGKKKKK